MKTKDLKDPRINILKSMMLQNTVWKEITTLDGIKRKSLIAKAHKFRRRTRKLYIP